MRLLVLIFLVFAPLATSAAWTSAARTTPVGSADAAAAPQEAGARPAGLKVSLGLYLRCGKPGPTPIVVSLPRAWRVPKTIAPRAVWIDRTHPQSVDVSRHELTLQPAPPYGKCTVL